MATAILRRLSESHCTSRRQHDNSEKTAFLTNRRERVITPLPSKANDNQYSNSKVPTLEHLGYNPIPPASSLPAHTPASNPLRLANRSSPHAINLLISTRFASQVQNKRCPKCPRFNSTTSANVSACWFSNRATQNSVSIIRGNTI